MIYTKKTHPELYSIWKDMKQRCYNPNRLIKRPTYQGCTVHDDWKDNFQQFAEDYTSMIGYGLPNRQIDKDILVKGNKVYSKDTCVLVPHDINILLTNCKNARGQYPIGVYYTDNNSPPYLARIRMHGKRVYIGRYHTPEEAFNAYKIVKEQHIKEMANLYSNELDPRVYNALMNWEILEYD
jgi:hypothetical protein